MADNLERLWLLLRSIPRAPRKVDGATLHGRLEDNGIRVNRRTIQRDLERLALYFPLVCDDRSKPYGWSWSRQAPGLELPGMEPWAALTVRLVAAHLRPLMPPGVLEAVERLAERAEGLLGALPSSSLSTWEKKVRVLPRGLMRAPLPVDGAIFQAVYAAVLEDRAIDVTYRARGASASKRYVVHPLALVARAPVFYLVCVRDQKVMQLTLHRFERCAVLDEPSVAPEEFDLDRYISSGAFDLLRSDRQIRLRVLLYPEVSHRLREGPIAADQQLSEWGDGRVLLEATLPDTQELRNWLLMYGETAEVLGPDWLRAEMAGYADQMAARYAADGVSERQPGD